MPDAVLDKGSPQLVGPKKVAERFGRGFKWARTLLREWYEEDVETGRKPPRVLRRRKHGGIVTYYTTIAVLNAHAPPARDEALVRAVSTLDKELDAFARKIVARLDEIDERLRFLERERAKVRMGSR